MKYQNDLRKQPPGVRDKRSSTFTSHQLCLTEISDQIWKIVDWVSETNKSSTFASLQLTLTRTLREIKAYTLKVRVAIREAQSIDYRLPVWHLSFPIFLDWFLMFLNLYATEVEVQSISYHLSVPHLIARLYQDCLRYFWTSSWQQEKLGGLTIVLFACLDFLYL
jgi:hypothetical protein